MKLEHYPFFAFSIYLFIPGAHSFYEPISKSFSNTGDRMDPTILSFPYLTKINSTLPSSRYEDIPSIFLDTNKRNKKPKFAFREQEHRSSPNKMISLSDKSLDDANIHSISAFLKLVRDSALEVFDTNDRNRKTRLIENRSYSKKMTHEDANIMEPPMLKDLAPPSAKLSDTFWASLPAAFLSFIVPYFSFPYLVRLMDLSIHPVMLNDVTDAFGPGVSILYGTFVSLTLSILYKRKDNIQNHAATESSLLAMTTRNLLTLFKKDRILAIQAGQSTADQIRILTDGSRGSELMMLMYNDPYARMLELLEKKEEQLMDMYEEPMELICHCRDDIRELYQVRADRLSDETLALPRNHFFILSSLTVLILLGYTIQIAVDSSINGVPTNESSAMFGLLCSIYILFYNFANDLNDPFGGIYQVRRSAAASHLFQIKWLMINHPDLQGEVDFNKVQKDLERDVVMQNSGVEQIWFKMLE